MNSAAILVTEADALRLRGLLAARGDVASHDQEHLRELESELDGAIIVGEDDVPEGVITMYSRVRTLDLASGERDEWQLVFPVDADVAERRISVLAPLGTALLGYREGDELEWPMPGGPRRIRIERAVQPAASPDGSAPAR